MVVRSSISSLVLKEKTHIEYWEFFVIEYLIRHTLACRKQCTVTNLLIKEDFGHYFEWELSVLSTLPIFDAPKNSPNPYLCF